MASLSNLFCRRAVLSKHSLHILLVRKKRAEHRGKGGRERERGTGYMKRGRQRDGVREWGQ